MRNAVYRLQEDIFVLFSGQKAFLRQMYHEQGPIAARELEARFTHELHQEVQQMMFQMEDVDPALRHISSRWWIVLWLYG